MKGVAGMGKIKCRNGLEGKKGEQQERRGKQNEQELRWSKETD